MAALIGGLLGAVALGALAGGRRTDSAYGRYLRSVNASDVLVDVPGPVLPVIKAIEHLPGALSTAAWLGLGGQPVIGGKVDDSFLTDALVGSLDGEYYRQDKLIVLAGRLPPPGATSELILNPSMASTFHLAVGDHMTWQFFRGSLVDGLPIGRPIPAGRVTFRIAAIADVPPALTDQFDNGPVAIVPPGGTARYLNGEFGFGWVAMRLRGGDAGVPALQRQLAGLTTAVKKRYGYNVAFNINRMAITKREAQQAIEPQALALAVLGGLAASRCWSSWRKHWPSCWTDWPAMVRHCGRWGLAEQTRRPWRGRGVRLRWWPPWFFRSAARSLSRRSRRSDLSGAMTRRAECRPTGLCSALAARSYFFC